jgi:fumarylacetoacetate (FAA) hydrolase
MKLVTFKTNDLAQTGILVNNQIFPLHTINPNIALTMRDMLNDWDNQSALAKAVEAEIIAGHHAALGIPCSNDILLAPVPQPTSCRDGYAFRQHVAAARRNRGVPMIPEFDRENTFVINHHCH